MSDNQKQSVHSKNVIEMLTVANEFCIFVEECEKHPVDFIFEYLQRICPLLYIKGSLIPKIEDSTDQASERFVTEEEWLAVFNRFRAKFGASDSYLFLEHDNGSEIETRKGSLADNLADIYQDLKDFIMLYQKKSIASQINAVLACRELFATHWGSRLVLAHGAIHRLLFKGTNPDPFSGFSYN